MRVVKLKLGLLAIMAGTVLSFGLLDSLKASAVDFQADAVTTEYLHQPITVANGDQKVILNLRQIGLRDLLKLLASKAGFNILLDESVQGNISVDLNNVSINQALESVKDYANLVYMQDDKTLVVANKESPLARTINQQVSQMIPVKYVNAKLVAEILNGTIFTTDTATTGAAAGTGSKASAEYRTNSVVIVGTDNDLRLAEEFIQMLDVPRQSKTFKINHSDVLYVTQTLKATVFNDGVAPYGTGGQVGAGTGAGGASNIPSTATTVEVSTETFQEGSGTTQVASASGGSGGGGQQTFTIRTKQQRDEKIAISPEGPILVPDTRTSTLTLMGTAEQIALAEAVIPSLDQKLPQVAIETSLVEIDENTYRYFNANLGTSSGRFAAGYANPIISNIQGGQPAIPPRSDATLTDWVTGESQTFANAIGRLFNVIGLPTVTGTSGNGSAIAFSTAPIDPNRDFIYQINTAISKNKAKLLANPTVIAVHNTEAVISITEEVVRRTTVTRDASGFQQIQVEIGEAGIILDIIPKIGGDGYITLRVSPRISSIANTLTDANGNLITLLKRKDLALQEVRIANNQTLAIGGLIQENMQKSSSILPGLGNLPLIGALFRSTLRNGDRTELIMLLTPRILEDGKPIISSSMTSHPESVISNSQMHPKDFSERVVNVPIKDDKTTSDSAVEVIVPPVTSSSQVSSVNKPVLTNDAYSVDKIIQDLENKDIQVDTTRQKTNKNQIDKLIKEYLPGQVSGQGS